MRFAQMYLGSGVQVDEYFLGVYAYFLGTHGKLDAPARTSSNVRVVSGVRVCVQGNSKNFTNFSRWCKKELLLWKHCSPVSAPPHHSDNDDVRA